MGTAALGSLRPWEGPLSALDMALAAKVKS